MVVPNGSKAETLNYLPLHDYPQNVHITLPDFVRRIYHLPDRFLDLLEIAAYVFSADRLVSKGLGIWWSIIARSRSLFSSSQSGTMIFGNNPLLVNPFRQHSNS